MVFNFHMDYKQFLLSLTSLQHCTPLNCKTKLLDCASVLSDSLSFLVFFLPFPFFFFLLFFLCFVFFFWLELLLGPKCHAQLFNENLASPNLNASHFANYIHCHSNHQTPVLARVESEALPQPVPVGQLNFNGPQ